MYNLHTHIAVIDNMRLIFQATTSSLLSSERLENAPVQIGLEPDEQLPAQRWMWQPISIACTLNILAPKRHIASCARSERFAVYLGSLIGSDSDFLISAAPLSATVSQSLAAPTTFSRCCKVMEQCG